MYYYYVLITINYTMTKQPIYTTSGGGLLWDLDDLDGLEDSDSEDLPPGAAIW